MIERFFHANGNPKKAGVVILISDKGKVTQSCLTVCDPIDCTVHRILQARMLEWVAIPFSRGYY